MKNDSEEYGNKLTVKDDLIKSRVFPGVPFSDTYHAPGDNASEKEKDDWRRLLINLFNNFDNFKYR